MTDGGAGLVRPLWLTGKSHATRAGPTGQLLAQAPYLLPCCDRCHSGDQEWTAREQSGASASDRQQGTAPEWALV